MKNFLCKDFIVPTMFIGCTSMLAYNLYTYGSAYIVIHGSVIGCLKGKTLSKETLKKQILIDQIVYKVIFIAKALFIALVSYKIFSKSDRRFIVKLAMELFLVALPDMIASVKLLDFAKNSS